MKKVFQALVFGYLLQVIQTMAILSIYLIEKPAIKTIIIFIPILYMINYFVCSLVFTKALKTVLKTYFPNVYNELFKIEPMVNGFKIISFVFSDEYNEIDGIKKIKNYMKNYYIIMMLIIAEVIFLTNI